VTKAASPEAGFLGLDTVDAPEPKLYSLSFVGASSPPATQERIAVEFDSPGEQNTPYCVELMPFGPEVPEPQEKAESPEPQSTKPGTLPEEAKAPGIELENFFRRPLPTSGSWLLPAAETASRSEDSRSHEVDEPESDAEPEPELPPPPPPAKKEADEDGKAAGGGRRARMDHYTPEQRQQKIQRYLEKRTRRNWKRKVRYETRRRFAVNRPRVNGKFVKFPQVE